MLLPYTQGTVKEVVQASGIDLVQGLAGAATACGCGGAAPTRVPPEAAHAGPAGAGAATT